MSLKERNTCLDNLAKALELSSSSLALSLKNSESSLMATTPHFMLDISTLKPSFFSPWNRKINKHRISYLFENLKTCSPSIQFSDAQISILKT